MARKGKLRSLAEVLKLHYALMFIFLMLVIAATLSMLFAFLFIQDEPVYYIVIGSTGLLALGAFIYFLIASAKLYKLVYKQGLKISSDNFEALANYRKEYKLIPNDRISEYKRLNDSFMELSMNLDARVLVSSALHYHGIDLHYLSVDHMEVDEKSLTENLTKLILASESYRNALLEIRYDLGDEDITERNKSIIVGLVKRLKYKNMLIAKKEDNHGFYVFIPAFDSIAQLEEELQILIRNISLVHRPFTGREIVLAQIGAVIYPFSDVDEMFSDLAEAMKSENKLNIYIPERSGGSGKKKLISALNMNNVSALLEELAGIDTHPSKYFENVDHIDRVIAKLSDYCGFAVSGYVLYNEDKDGYFPRFRHSDRKDDFVFEDGYEVDKNFIKLLGEIQDKDHSYFFRSRHHVNNDFGRFIDYYRISSGLFYNIIINGQNDGIIYFVNKGGELYFDSFMKEALIVSCYLISTIIKEMEDRRIISVISKRYRNLLKISGVNIYSVEKDNYNLVIVSDAIKRLSPIAQPGVHCYKALYGLDSPCKDCPLKTSKHKNVKIKDVKYESYEILKNDDDHYANIILKANKAETTHERFDDELLLPTFYSFHESMSNQYLLGREGNVLLLAIRNADEIAKIGGNTLYNKVMIALNSLIYDKYKSKMDVYFYNRKSLAVLYPNSNEDDLIALAEFISAGIKDIPELKDVDLDMVYLVKSYSAEQEMKDVFDKLENLVLTMEEHNKDQIVFSDSDYKRNASREGYIFDIAEEAFNKKTFTFAYQPIVENKERSIVGSELLLRITDPYTKMLIDPGKVLKIVTERGYIGKVYNETLTYLDELFKKMGYTFFMTSGLTHLSINVDHSFFADISLIDRIKEILESNNLPKGFIGLEIDEVDIYDNMDIMKANSAKAVEAGAKLIVDKYDGTKLSAADVRLLGFHGVKVTRNLVTAISNKEEREKLMNVWAETHKAGLVTIFVGVENRVISEAIHLEDYDCFVQGNYFYAPLSEDNAFEAIRQRNMKDKEMDN